ncbi:hypothetical protein B0T20DRAFT_381366 [Sordaria brevicollis]|uniref:NACHT domain-containing protein n=1 Tax=Sordaria brevicollis TaxID=83679 RepID=A0AAE0PB80_SORBR|nr:hypothetical protein B0T20DRAFT_381366 [Sordaria brevicollis]
MDPVSAIGLTVSILSFIEKGTKIARTAYDIRQSAAGVHEDVARQEADIAMLQAFCERIRHSEHSHTDSDSDYHAITTLAQECERLASELIELIQAIKGGKSWLASVAAAIKQKKTERRRNAIQTQLEKYRNDIVTELGLWNQERNHLLLTELKRAVDNQDKNKLERFNGVMNTVQQISVTVPACKGHVDGLLAMEADILDRVTQHRVLKALYFDNMKQRQENVTVAHEQTFKWSLEGSGHSTSQDTAVEDKEKQKARELFVDWLTHGDGIFHIYGKLGSGKSTLMKYLSDNDVTTSLLQKWTAGRQLVTARFFFWKPGGELQNTLTGLKRTLLHDILHDCPDLIPSVLPQIWDRCKAIPWQTGDAKFEISRREVDDAFSKLITHATTSTHKQRCFCIFIDGLDEYVGTPGCDTIDLVVELQKWVKQTSQVKICVSSRPDNVFMNAFDPHRQIKLHDLTRGDMQAYIRAQLEHMDFPGCRDELAGIVVEKAEGIFLWVTLAVKSIRVQIENGFSTADMIRNVRLLPTELEELFKHILSSLIDPRKGYRTLVMTKLAMAYNIKVPLYSYSFFDAYDQDPQFAFNLQVRESHVQATADDQQRIQRARQQLRAYCGGLVEDVRDSAWGKFQEPYVNIEPPDTTVTSEFNVEFTHRSIPEFLERADMQEDINIHTKNHSSGDCLSQLFLATLTRRNNIGTNFDFKVPRILYQIPMFLRLRHELDLDFAPFEFWERFEFVQLKRYQRVNCPWEMSNEFGIQLEVSPLNYLSSHRINKAEYDVSGAGSFKKGPLSWIPPVCIAAHHGYVDYPLWRFQTSVCDQGHSRLKDNSKTLGLITHYAIHQDDWAASLKLATELLRRGHLNTHMETDLWLERRLELCCAPTPINIWHQYIMVWIIEKAAGIPICMSRQRLALEPIAELIELFLEKGGSPHLTVSWGPGIVSRYSRDDRDKLPPDEKNYAHTHSLLHSHVYPPITADIIYMCFYW